MAFEGKERDLLMKTCAYEEETPVLVSIIYIVFWGEKKETYL
jgi:hypothetical protein